MSYGATDEMWDVQLASGFVRTMTLDELDAAYQSGTVDEATPVRQSGAPHWSTLGAVAGTEDSFVPEPANSISPMQVTLPPPPAVPREFAHLADLDGDEELLLRPKKRRKKKAVAGILGVAVIAGLVGYGASRASSAALAEAGPGAALAAAAPPPAVTALPAPAETTAATADKRALSEDQKRALLDADQKRAAEAEKKRVKNAGHHSSSPRRSKKTGDGLLKGGDKYDPLNGNL
jgi:hypothetical protein